MTFWRTPIAVPVGHRARWDFGNRGLWAERHSGQWLLGGPDAIREEPRTPTVEVRPAPDAPESDGPPRRRVALRGEARTIELVPRPPPRPLIARPELPLVVPSGERTRVYVGVPLWIGVEDDGEALYEVPALLLSDTWFGTPAEGQLCYATRTHLRMGIGDVPRVSHRATCVIDVRNNHSEPLVLERVRIPAPSLTVYADARDRLWTSPVRLGRDKGDKASELTEVLAQPPSEAGPLRAIGAAREPLSAPILGRVFNAMWIVGGGP